MRGVPEMPRDSADFSEGMRIRAPTILNPHRGLDMTQSFTGLHAYAEHLSLCTNRPEGMRYLKVGADLSANTAFQTLHLHRMYQLSRTSPLVW